MISAKIKELRIERGLTQIEVAEAIGYSNSILSDWERGTKQPTASAIINVCKFYDVSSDYLLGLNADEYPSPLPTREPANIPQEICPNKIANQLNDLSQLELAQVKGFIAALKQKQ